MSDYTSAMYGGAPDECNQHWPSKPHECAELHRSNIIHWQYQAWHHHKQSRRWAEYGGERKFAINSQQRAADDSRYARDMYQLHYGSNA